VPHSKLISVANIHVRGYFALSGCGCAFQSTMCQDFVVARIARSQFKNGQDFVHLIWELCLCGGVPGRRYVSVTGFIGVGLPGKVYVGRWGRQLGIGQSWVHICDLHVQGYAGIGWAFGTWGRQVSRVPQMSHIEFEICLRFHFCFCLCNQNRPIRDHIFAAGLGASVTNGGPDVGFVVAVLFLNRKGW